MKRDLLIFGEDWGRHPSSTQHLAKHLASDRKILWVNSIGMRRPRIGLGDMRRLGRKLGASLKPMRPAHSVTVPQNMVIHNPMAVPAPGNRLAAAVNRQTVGRKLKHLMAAHGMNRPVIWASLPTAVDLLDSLPRHPVVYYCGDEFGALAGVDHKPVLECEKRLARRADVIFAASETLSAKFDTSKTRHLPHGVSLDTFTTPAERAVDLPGGQPVAGFYGSISEWLDQDLLLQCARRLPSWLFVLVGEVRCDVSRLARASNIRLIGPRPHEDLPGYVQHWDVSIMPFIDNEQIRACNPLKLREYLAAGRPVVATPFPAATPYTPAVRLEADAAAFSSAIVDSGREPPSRGGYRRSLVATESWQQRANDVRTVIDRM